MTSHDDTIAALATPVGQGGIGIVRISGTEALNIAERIFRPRNAGRSPSNAGTYSMMYGDIIDPSEGAIVDEVIISVMRAPHTYTREDVIEINAHGGMAIVRKILGLALAAGARLACPGEFTKRAFINGRIGLTQAEAVMDLISARTDESRRIALEQLRGGLGEKLDAVRKELIDLCALSEAYIDFPEDEIEIRASEDIIVRLEGIREELGRLSKTYDEARFFRDGLSVAIIGRPNVGKSSLLNALLQQDRAIVTEIPGTTRDLIEEYLNINGLPVRIIDTAGIRDSGEAVELEGIKRSLGAMEKADCILAVFDGSSALERTDEELLRKLRGRNAIIVINKADLPERICLDGAPSDRFPVARISAVTGEGLDLLKSVVFTANLCDWKEEREGVVITNIRQKLSVDMAAAALLRAVDTLRADQPLEIFSLELRSALDSIGEVTGVVTHEEILDKIFSEFCIGK